MTAQNGAISYDPRTRQLECRGDWDLNTLPKLKNLFNKISWPTKGEVTINGHAIAKMDSAGAWLLNTWINQLKHQTITINLENFSKQHQILLSLVEKRLLEETKPPEIKKMPWMAYIGKLTLVQLYGFQSYLNFIGQLGMESLRLIKNPTHIRWASLVSVVYRNGYLALPIIALLSFMIGVVLTYQMGLQLRNYGANIYIVDLLGLAVLREFGPLLTAIMVAGRTGSAFTAQLGMMKINQEIDALDTMSVTPTELLIIPRIVGLFIALPLLTMWANVFGILGGMVMANNMLNITWYDFLHRFPTVIPLRSLIIGLGKAPVFALIIASIGCFEGMNVKNNADSVGQNTTRSVVLAIFFIIVADAIFSIIFSKLKL